MNLPLRVLFFDHTAELGGGEIALRNLLVQLDRKTVYPIVVLGSDGPLAEQLRAVAEVHVLPLSAEISKAKKDSFGFATLIRFREILLLTGYIWRLARFVADREIDLVHTNSLKSDVIGGISARLAGRPVIWHVRDRIAGDYLRGPIVRIFRLLCRVVPNYLIANSFATLQTLGLPQRHPVRSSQDSRFYKHSSVVHDGTDPSAFSQPEAAPAATALRVGLIGRITPWKGQHIFLRAAAIVARRFPQARFIIVGSTLFGEESYDADIRRLAIELGIEGSVEFAGFRSDVNAVLAGLNVVVHASTIGEPFGQVIIEGMAAGKPMVATNGGGVPEIVQDGETGILVPMNDAGAMADAISKLLGDPALAKTMGRKGREMICDHFRIDQTARKVEAIYQAFAETESPTDAVWCRRFFRRFGTE